MAFSITEVSAGDHPFAKSIKNAVDKANRWRTGKRIAGALLSAAADGAKELFDTVADESNDYQQFIETKAQFETAAREHLQRHPQGRICIYIDDLDRCEPLTSVNVLRVVQVLCRTRGCVLVLGLDRDVIIQNLRKAYPDSDFGKEYLDKIVQLHIEVPPIPLSPIVDTLKTKGNGHPREGIEKYSTWIAEAMGYNPRKVERAVNLYDYKLSVLKHGELSRPDLDLPRIAAKFTVIELLWPALATAMAESDEIDQG